MDKRDTIEHNETRDLNRDPLTGTPGSHPVGVGVGGVGGAAAGAVIGALGGPLGMLIGGGIGTLVGAAAGKGVAERIDPTGEAEFWRESYTSRPYHDARFDYENDYAPAYGYGVDARNRLPERTWDESLERELGAGWGQVRGESKLEWDHARDARRLGPQRPHPSRLRGQRPLLRRPVRQGRLPRRRRAVRRLPSGVPLRHPGTRALCRPPVGRPPGERARPGLGEGEGQLTPGLGQGQARHP